MTDYEKRAKNVLQKFLTAWVKGNFDKCYKYSTVTYKRLHSKLSPSQMDKEVKAFKILDNGARTGAALRRFRVMLTIKINGRMVDKYTLINVICETGLRKPDATLRGVWGVNPDSIRPENRI